MEGTASAGPMWSSVEKWGEATLPAAKVSSPLLEVVVATLSWRRPWHGSSAACASMSNIQKTQATATTGTSKSSRGQPSPNALVRLS